MRPNRLIVRAYLARGAWLWVLARALLLAVLVFAPSFAPRDPTLPSPAEMLFRPSPVAMLWTVMLSVMLGWADVGRRRERALLGNLGVRPLHLTAFFAVTAAAGETVVVLVAGFFP